MKPEEWNEIKHFKPDEFDYPDFIDFNSLSMLDSMREKEKKIIIINSDFAFTGHSDNSMHYKGKAFDIVIKDKNTKEPLPIIEQFLIAIRYFWTGIGFYPFWKVPGLHVDTRPLTLLDRRATWWKDKEGEYRPIEEYFK